MKFLFLLCFSLATFAQNLTDKNDPVVAKVNGKDVFKSQLYNYHIQNLNVVNGMKEVTLMDSLNDIINRIISVDRAKKNKIDKDPRVIKKMNDILYHAQVSKDLEPKLLGIGEVSDSEVKTFYSDNPEYRTAHILYKMKSIPSATEVKQGLEVISQIYEKVKKKPNKFMEFAVQYSQSSSSTMGADLGYLPVTRYVKKYYDQIKGKDVGHITKPFRTQFGWHVVKILGVKKFKQIEVNVYKKIIFDIKRDKLIADYFEDLRKSNEVKVFNSRIE